MCYGMPRFQFNASLRGCPARSDLDDYCYYVAGVVGEMLTELFCDYSPDIARRRPALSALAVSFAQGLQMTNILKDVWEDRSRGACWLPQEVFSRHGVDLARLSPRARRPALRRRHARTGRRGACAPAQRLDYTLLIPGNETGIRRFCLWAIGLAVLTLRKIAQNPGFTAGAQVKVSRSAVSHDHVLDQYFVRNDWLLRRLFARRRARPAARAASRAAPAARRPPGQT